MTSKKRSNTIIFGIGSIIICLLIALFVYAVSGSLWLGILIAIFLLMLCLILIKKRLKALAIITAEPPLQSIQKKKPYILVPKSIGEAIGSFEIQIPLNINYNNLLGSFKKQYENSFGKINPKINDVNFANISDKLTPGEVYRGEFYPLLNKISTDKCRDFLLTKASLMTGPQGLALLWELAEEKMPNGKYIISLDYNDRVMKENGLAIFPFIDHIPGQQDEFELLSEGILWLPDGCIFSINKKSSN